MNVQVHEFEDKSEKDDDGFYQYFYRGKNFIFEEDTTTVTARTYEETPEEADFMSLNGRIFDSETILHPLLHKAEDYLRKMGCSKFKILFSRGYVRYPLSGK